MGAGMVGLGPVPGLDMTGREPVPVWLAVLRVARAGGVGVPIPALLRAATSARVSRGCFTMG